MSSYVCVCVCVNLGLFVCLKGEKKEKEWCGHYEFDGWWMPVPFVSAQGTLSWEKCRVYGTRRNERTLAWRNIRLREHIPPALCGDQEAAPKCLAYPHLNFWEDTLSPADYRLNSFFPRTVRDWNTLPPETVSAPSIGAFISRVAKLQYTTTFYPAPLPLFSFL